MRNFLFIILSLCSLHALAQNNETIKNNGFEENINKPTQLPNDWFCKPSKSVKIYCDSITKHTGKYALKVATTDSNSRVSGCIQTFDYTTNIPKKIKITCWAKTINCIKGAGMECVQLDKNGKELGLANSLFQQAKLIGTNNWTKMELLILLNPKVQQLELNIYFNSIGTCWFDDISVEEIPATNISTSPKVVAFLDTLIRVVKQNALVKDSINWQIFTTELNTLATGMQTYKEAELLASYVIDELHQHGDNHSLYLQAFRVLQFNNSDIMGAGRSVIAKYLGNGIGYVSMPGFASGKDSLRVAFATTTQQLIKKIDTENKVNSWIVDLRDNNGGGYAPMIIGLGPILQEGLFNLQIDGKDTLREMYQNGADFYLGSKNETDTLVKISNPYYLKNKSVPVAVLIGSGCGSSGENTALAFVGKPNTKLFGQPTAGFTKGNEGFYLPDSSMILVSSGVSSDRNGKKYPDRVYPDMPIKQLPNSKIDATLNAAKKWLMTFRQ